MQPVLAVAVEPGRLAAGLVDTTGTVLVRDRVSMPSRDVWRSLERLVRRVLAATPEAIEPFGEVAVSCVGPVDLASGSVTPPHVPSWLNFPLREHLETLTERTVVLESAGAAATESERWVGEARDVPSYVSIVVDAVVDSGCVVDGIRLSGAHGNAGALAHIVVDPAGKSCWCGASGCLDPYVSAIALEAEMNRPLGRATDSLIDRAGIMLGRAIATFAATVDVTVFYVSGGVVDAFGDRMLEASRREIRARSKLASLADLRVVEPVEHIPSLVSAAALVVGRAPADRSATDR